MVKPSHFGGYSDAYTVDCERVLVTLLRGLGPWTESVFLVGGLTPRYLVPQRPPDVPAHAGTLDVDIVIDLQLLADTDAYHSLKDNLKRMGFERAVNEQGLKLSWRWQTRTEHGALMVLELLADAPQIAGGRVQPLPTEGTISALNIPHSSIVFDLHQVTEIRAELLGENGMATERVKHADIVSFTCLKAFAFDQRFERKDAHDLVYCIEHAPDGLGAVVAAFGHALAGTHSAPRNGDTHRSLPTCLGTIVGSSSFADSKHQVAQGRRGKRACGATARTRCHGLCRALENEDRLEQNFQFLDERLLAGVGSQGEPRACLDRRGIVSAVGLSLGRSGATFPIAAIAAVTRRGDFERVNLP